MKTRSLTMTACLLFALAVSPAFSGEPPPSLTSPDLAKGPYSSMHMLLEKTFLKVDVLTVDVRFGNAIHAKLKELAQGKAYSDALGKQVANVAIAADDAVVQLKFARDVSLNQWMDAVRDNLKQARDAGLITPAVQQKVAQGLVRRDQRSGLQKGRPRALPSEERLAPHRRRCTRRQGIRRQNGSRQGRPARRHGELLRARKRLPRTPLALAVQTLRLSAPAKRSG